MVAIRQQDNLSGGRGFLRRLDHFQGPVALGKVRAGRPVGPGRIHETGLGGQRQEPRPEESGERAAGMGKPSEADCFPVACGELAGAVDLKILQSLPHIAGAQSVACHLPGGGGEQQQEQRGDDARRQVGPLGAYFAPDSPQFQKGDKGRAADIEESPKPGPMFLPGTG